MASQSVSSAVTLPALQCCTLKKRAFVCVCTTLNIWDEVPEDHVSGDIVIAIVQTHCRWASVNLALGVNYYCPVHYAVMCYSRPTAGTMVLLWTRQ